MSKQHKMEHEGKRYVTKFGEGDACEGCSFLEVMEDVCALSRFPRNNENVRCQAKANEDNKCRIWVEDTSAPKKVKVKTMNKSIQHKMEYKGKKYITKIGSSYCIGCFFYSDGCVGVEGREMCFASKNQDRLNRIWVEVKSEDKPKKEDHVWVVEYYDDVEKDWFIWGAQENRKTARAIAESMVSKTRVRKFILAK